jgi:hypothetical protein
MAGSCEQGNGPGFMKAVFLTEYQLLKVKCIINHEDDSLLGYSAV